MAQVFGNRILGGIGAPGGGMSESFGAGVNTALGQRESRQGMAGEAQRQRMLEQEFAWRGQDREEARRRAAAAAAASAAAKARDAAMARELIATMGTTGPGLTIPPGQTFGPRVSVGGPTPMLPPSGAPAAAPAPTATPAPTAGLRTSVPLSFGTGGGAGVDMIRGGPGADTLAAPPAGGAMDYSGFVTAARQGKPITMDQLVAAVNANTLSTQQAADVQAMIDSGYVPSEADVRAAMAPGVTPSRAYAPTATQAAVADWIGGVTGRTRGDQAAIDAERARLRGETVAPEAAAEATAPAVDTSQYPIGQLPVAPSPRLSFGPLLGAVEADPNASVVAKVEANPPGQAQPTPNAELYIMEPGRPGRELQQAMDLRAQYAQAAQIYEKYGDYAAVRDMFSKIQELDSTLYYLQGMQGLQELQFNSPQRLTMVLSEQLGRNIGIQPNSAGGYDVYVDGQLALQKDAGGGENSLSYWARSLLDTNFAQAEAARADEYNKLRTEAEIDVAKQVAIDANKAANDEWLKRVDADIAVESALLDARLNPAAIELQVDENTSEVIVYDKINRQMLGTITRADPLNPEVPLSQPTFVPAQ